MKGLYLSRVLKNHLWIVLLLSGCSGSAERTLNKPGTLEMTPQTADFVRSYKTAQLTQAAANGIPLQVSVRIGAITDDNVCLTGQLYGPYTVTNGSLVEGVQTATANPPTLRLANMGNLALCMIITSPVDVTLNLSADSLAMSTTECNETPAEISGTWAGEYSCSSSCGDESGYVVLDIQQEGYSATYTTYEASYEGTVCGNSFEFSGSGPGYTESGTFVINDDGSASKTSRYMGSDGLCGGSCSDPVLQRY